MTGTPKHRIRHENAFRAGAREGIRDLLADLIALSPAEAHANLRGIAEALLTRPKHQRIERSARG